MTLNFLKSHKKPNYFLLNPLTEPNKITKTNNNASGFPAAGNVFALTTLLTGVELL